LSKGNCFKLLNAFLIKLLLAFKTKLSLPLII
jgi:hypothetical protein